jgi:transposase
MSRMKAYSFDLRQKVIDAVDRGIATYEKIAATFGVSQSFLYKLLRQRCATGEIAPLPHGGGATAKLDEEELLALADLVAEQPDATLEELRQRLQRRQKVAVSLSTIWRGLEQMELTLKKRPAGPARPAPKSGRPLPGTKRNCRVSG